MQLENVYSPSLVTKECNLSVYVCQFHKLFLYCVPVCVVTNDEMTLRLKGKTVCTESERYDALRHCRYVDEILTDAPWVITPEFMEEHQVRRVGCHTPPSSH